MLRVGIVGLGRMGKTHAQNMVNHIPEVKLVAACSIFEEELLYAKEYLGVENTYSSFEKMIDEAKLDFVVIAAGADVRPSMICYAMEKGIHTFAEKPLGLSEEDIKKVVEVVEKYKDRVKFQVGFMRRFDADYLYAKEKIESGEIGSIVYIRAYGIDPSSGLDSFVNFAKNSNSGGIYHDMAIHDIDLIRWLTGCEFSKVWAVGANFARPELDEVGELETGIVQAQLNNGAMVHLVVGRNAPHGYQVETEIMGTKGWLRIAGVPEKNLVTIYDHTGVRRECSANFPERFKKAFIEEIVGFARCIKENRNPQASAQDGLIATRVSLVCQQSLQEGIIKEC
ncbi:Gfo/Idh/MocA family oxidoreductase [Gemella sp. zg-570]|uniref:Gfo/Idh/MocA family protein n=1 Tax=Gemella sp. zg-570 TaxID=2840371 RepID=UPI001C0E43A0|nr:Gfo/Idh/MocA family oxidoreductase [Gemella sp. zg-570]QWQ38801.1 Gfo/Idh/MocA family oxidoreductase [Gemella sp. zg-570]